MITRFVGGPADGRLLWVRPDLDEVKLTTSAPVAVPGRGEFEVLRVSLYRRTGEVFRYEVPLPL